MAGILLVLLLFGLLQQGCQTDDESCDKPVNRLNFKIEIHDCNILFVCALVTMLLFKLCWFICFLNHTFRIFNAKMCRCNSGNYYYAYIAWLDKNIWRLIAPWSRYVFRLLLIVAFQYGSPLCTIYTTLEERHRNEHDEPCIYSVKLREDSKCDGRPFW